MIPDYPDLEPLGVADLPALAEAYRASSPGTCDASPVNLFIWQDCQEPWLTRIRGHPDVLLRSHTEPPYYLEPYGGNDLYETVCTCLDHVGLISRAQGRLSSSLPPEEFEVRPQRDAFDYIYRVQALAELKGKSFDGKRNHIRKFVRNYPEYEFRPLDPPLLRDAAELFEAWATARENGRSGTLAAGSLNHECQRRALERAFAEYPRLGLIGGALTVRDAMQGVVVASRGIGDTAIVHFSYANAELPGIYQTLLWEACRRLFGTFTYLNLEEDMGIAGLRKTKLSWHPLKLEEKYSIRPRTRPTPRATGIA